MRIRILVIALLAALVLALGLPAAIGWLVHDRIAAAVDEALPGATFDADRGWFQSAATLEDAGFRARANFRHLPLAPPGWLALDGRVILEEPVATIDAGGRIGLNGSISARAGAPALDLTGPVTWRYRDPEIRLTSSGDHGLRLSGSAESLLIVDGLGNRLAFEEPALSLTIDAAPGPSAPDQLVTAGLEVDANRVGQPPSRLVLRFESVDPGALEELAVALGQLVGAEPESAGSGLAAVGAASAWQQLASAGLVIELDELVLDDRLSLSGRWSPNEKRFGVNGEGARETAQAWWATIVGLAEQLRPAEARESARLALDDLAAQGVLSVEGGGITVQARSLPAGG